MSQVQVAAVSVQQPCPPLPAPITCPVTLISAPELGNIHVKIIVRRSPTPNAHLKFERLPSSSLLFRRRHLNVRVLPEVTQIPNRQVDPKPHLCRHDDERHIEAQHAHDEE